MGKVKKKCCRSKPTRCSKCPVVALRLDRMKAQGLTGKDRKRAVAQARVY